MSEEEALTGFVVCERLVIYGENSCGDVRRGG